MSIKVYVLSKYEDDAMSKFIRKLAFLDPLCRRAVERDDAALCEIKTN